MSRRLVTDVMAGGWLSVFRGAGIEFDEVREYVEGDDPRAVDWSVTARMGRPFVKTYADEREQTVLFLLDLSASMTGGFGAWSARQTAARVCAALPGRARNDDKVGLVAFSGGVDRFVPPKKGIGHVLRIVRDCLALRDARPAPTRRRPSMVTRAVPPRGGVRRGLPRGRVAHPAHLARVARVIAVRLVAGLVLPDAGLVHLRDPETGVAHLVDTGSPEVRAAYAARVAAWRAATDDAFRRAHVDVLEVPVPRTPGPEAVAGPILAFFRMRDLRGAKR
jgi:uncharacterized protein (DUF58 family)